MRGKERVKSGTDNLLVEHPSVFYRDESLLREITNSGIIYVYDLEVKIQKPLKYFSNRENDENQQGCLLKKLLKRYWSQWDKLLLFLQEL